MILCVWGILRVAVTQSRRNPLLPKGISSTRALLRKFRSGLACERLVRSPLLPPVSFLRESLDSPGRFFIFTRRRRCRRIESPRHNSPGNAQRSCCTSFLRGSNTPIHSRRIASRGSHRHCCTRPIGTVRYRAVAHIRHTLPDRRAYIRLRLHTVPTHIRRCSVRRRSRRRPVHGWAHIRHLGCSNCSTRSNCRRRRGDVAYRRYRRNAPPAFHSRSDRIARLRDIGCHRRRR